MGLLCFYCLDFVRVYLVSWATNNTDRLPIYHQIKDVLQVDLRCVHYGVYFGRVDLIGRFQLLSKGAEENGLGKQVSPNIMWCS
jgi:hypothetical protein